jgi:hypothetical protein
LIGGGAAGTAPLALTLLAGAPHAWTDLFTGQSLESANGALLWPHGPTRFPVIMLTADAQ